MLEGALQIGHAAQELGLIDEKLLLPLGSQLQQVCTGILHLGRCRCDHGQHALGFVQGLEGGLDASHHVAVELHLFAYVPIQRAGDQLFDGLRQPRAD